MSVKLYDEAIYNLINSWVHDKKMRILKPDETAALFSINADLNADNPLTLPLIALSRNTNIEILDTKKTLFSFDGKSIGGDTKETIQLNAIPIQLGYQLDIYTKFSDEAYEYVREFVFAIVNNPQIYITIPYNGVDLKTKANIRVLSTISDNSDISERLFRDQFTRVTLQIDVMDAYFFSVPFNKNARIESAFVSDSTSGAVKNDSELHIMNFDGLTIDTKEKL